MEKNPSFDGDELQSGGRVAVLFAGEGCGFTRRFIPTFESWTPPEGVRKAVRWVDMSRDRMWDTFELRVTPTLALFEEGALVARRDGRPHEGLYEEDLRHLMSDAGGAGGRASRTRNPDVPH